MGEKPANREQTRRDAEEVISHGSFVHEDLPAEVAQHCLALLAELEQAERRAENFGKDWEHERDKREQAEQERDEAHMSVGYWKSEAEIAKDHLRSEERLHRATEARLVKMDDLVEALRVYVDDALARYEQSLGERMSAGCHTPATSGLIRI